MELHRSRFLERSAGGTYAPDTVSWAQLEPGNFEVRYGLIDAKPLRVALRTMNLGFKGEAQLAAQSTLVGIVAQPQTAARWTGAPMDPDSIGSSTAFVEVCTSGAASFYTVGIDTPSLAGEFSASPDVLTLLETWPREGLAREPALARRLRAAMHRLFSISLHGAARSREIPPRIVSGTLIPLLASAVHDRDGRAIARSKCLNRRLAAVRACETFMREHVDETLTLLDLSLVSGMRSRSLINAFEAVTGYSPMDYLKRVRLNGVHRTLQRARRNAARIIDIATDWGFWHMGHFTADYRMMFGETPSQTLLR